MTTIALGGGPTLEQRRNFAALQDGSHLPGYQGYCPQIKYRVGKTYGQDTHELAKSNIFEYRRPTSILMPARAETMRNEIPDATGDNKYTKNMMPGYTGYIPTMSFKFGETYKNDCDACIDNFMTSRKVADAKQFDLKRQISSYPRLTSISHDPHVRDYLNLHREPRGNNLVLQDDRRAWTEPPIPGYLGYIPRIRPTELGLGRRYHEATKKGLVNFKKENERYRSLKNEPVTIDRNPETSRRVPVSMNSRLYQSDGMIPKYTGYIPQRRFVFGNTYGDTTRSLEVCAHDDPSFGMYISNNPRQQTVM